MPRLAAASASCILCLFLLAPGAAAQLAPVGQPHRIHDLYDVEPMDVAVQPDGSHLVIWVQLRDSSHPETWHLLAQAFNLQGQALGPQQEVAESVINAEAVALPGGRFLVVWEKGGVVFLPNRLLGRFLGPDGALQGSPFSLTDVGGTGVDEYYLRTAAAADGSFAAVWAYTQWHTSPSGTLTIDKQFRFRVFQPDGTPQGASIALGPLRRVSNADSSRGTVDSFPNGGWCVVWAEETAEGQAPAIFAQRFSAQGLAAGATQTAVQAGAADFVFASFPEAAAHPDGSCTVLWRSFEPSATFPPRIYARRLRADDGLDPTTIEPTVGRTLGFGFAAAGDRRGHVVLAHTDGATNQILRLLDARGEVLSARTEAPHSRTANWLVLGVGDGGDAAVAWQAQIEDSTSGQHDVLVRTFVPRCSGDEHALCLGANGRFRLTASWQDGSGQSNPGHAVLLTTDSGGFWFFSSGNAEMLVKVLDGRGLNGFFWVFFAGLTNLPTTLTITDTVTGAVRTYTNPSGKFPSRADTHAFADAAPAAAAAPVELAAAPAPPAAQTPCFSSDGALCLQDRFKLEIRWRDATGRTGSAHARQAAGIDAGYFWFFDPDNLEIAVKVLDGRAVNGHYWVFLGALTNVELTLTVTDTLTGAQRTYTNRLGRMRSFADTAAF